MISRKTRVLLATVTCSWCGLSIYIFLILTPQSLNDDICSSLFRSAAHATSMVKIQSLLSRYHLLSQLEVLPNDSRLLRHGISDVFLFDKNTSCRDLSI